MRIRTSVRFDGEADVEISLRQVMDSILEDPSGAEKCFEGLNHAAVFIRAIPASVIGQMSMRSRALVYQFLSEQLERFRP